MKWSEVHQPCATFGISIKCQSNEVERSASTVRNIWSIEQVERNLPEQGGEAAVRPERHAGATSPACVQILTWSNFHVLLGLFRLVDWTH
ncbi:hypothetical protein DY000_02037630 [Brassica cretica]|uniref:Uncharacterized protein n=1 Tax=Brassica cretica TaxID=69181 RepID=A0ABQ7BK84_BRACR|nr:hypothetical protein DY000_02037630 [Brassica cretica]